MEAVYDTPYVLSLVQPLLADIVWRHVRSMAVVVSTLDVDVRAGSSACGVCDSAAAAVCSVFLREALTAGMEAVYGLKEENRFVHTVDEWLGHEHIVNLANEMFAIPGLVGAVLGTMLNGV
jgi:hypothetical protein